MNERNSFRSVLIFGGAGFIGSNWAAYLLEHSDAKIHIFDNLSRPGARHNLTWLEKLAQGTSRLKITIGDVRDAAHVARAVRYATEIYHLAAQVAVTTSLRDPRLDFDVNLGGSFNILEAARTHGCRPFMLFTSTNKVYGSLSASKALHGEAGSVGVSEQQPLDFHSPYGCSKGAADQYVHDYARIFGIPTVVFRMSCIAGPRQFGNEDQGWIAHFLYSALDRAPLTIYGNGQQVRDVLHVHDLVRAFDSARTNLTATAGNVYNMGGGTANAVSLLQVIAAIERLTGEKIHLDYAPVRAADQSIYVTNFSKFTRHTGWRPELPLSAILSDIHAFRCENQQLFQPPVETEEPNVLAELPRVA